MKLVTDVHDDLNTIFLVTFTVLKVVTFTTFTLTGHPVAIIEQMSLGAITYLRQLFQYLVPVVGRRTTVVHVAPRLEPNIQIIW